MIKEEYICRQNAYRYFWPELNGKCKQGWCLHHKDPSWSKNDPERYHKWNVEDLIPMTFSEHTRWHAENDPEFAYKGKHHSDESKKKISKSRIGKYVGENTSFFGKHHSEESKKKMSEAHLGLNVGKHWYNNGEMNVFQKECPKGFRKGRLI